MSRAAEQSKTPRNAAGGAKRAAAARVAPVDALGPSLQATRRAGEGAVRGAPCGAGAGGGAQDAGAPRAAAAVARGGAPLPAALRAYFEPRFGVGLSGVRVHAGAAAGAAARAVGAQAFAFGRNLAFAPGRYAPETPSGLRLIAHELAHVAQTGGAAPPAGQATLGAPRDPAEREAERMAAAAAAGRALRPRARSAPAVLRRFTAPIPVPERTYVAGQDPEGDGFLRNALIFHRQWGLNPISIDSLEDVVDDLKGGAGLIGRIRIVTHASQSQLFTALFEGGAPGVNESELRGFAAGREAGVRAEIYGGQGGNLAAEATYLNMLGIVRQDAPAALRPFGLDQGAPALPGAVGVFFRRAVDLLFYRTAAMSVSERQVMAGIQRELAARRPAVAAMTLPGGGHPTDAQIDALRDAVLAINAQNVQLNPRLSRNVGAAETAIAGGFYADLRAVRARFDGSSWIDVRGCRIGGDRGYMEALAMFFGRAGALPHISAPQLFQMYPSLGDWLISERSISATVRDPAVRAALDHWFDAAGLLERARWAYSAWLNILVESIAAEVSRLRLSLGAPPGLRGGLRAPADPDSILPPLQIGSGLEPLRFRDLQMSLTGPPRPVASPIRSMAEAEAERLRREIETIPRMRPAQKLRYYLEHDLLLPVVAPGGDRSQIRLLALRGHQGAALSNWLQSIWASATPGLAQMRRMSFSDIDARRVEAMTEARRVYRPGRTFVAPDPDYRSRITET
jgi:hypothetical protein